MKNKIVKRILIATVAAAVAAGGITGGLHYQRSNRTAKVTAVSSLTDSYWGDEVYSSGQVTNDYSQFVYVPKTDTIKEVFVEDGQHVNIGDKLLELDTRASKLEYEMKVLEVENLANQIKLAENDLKKWKNMKPGTSRSTGEIVPTPNGAAGFIKTARQENAEPEKDKDAYRYIDMNAIPYNQDEADGTPEKPYRYICTEDAYILGEVLQSLAEKNITAYFEIHENNAVEGKVTVTRSVDDFLRKVPEEGSKWSVREGTQITEENPAEPAPGGENTQDPGKTGEEENGSSKKPGEENNDSSNKNETEQEPGQGENHGDGESDNIDDGITGDEELDPGDDFESYNEFIDDGYTKEEIQDQIAECEQKLKDLDLSKRKAELEVEKLKAKSTDGTIYATVNGEVKNLKDMEERDDDTAPFMEVAGSEGLYVTGFLSELLLDQVKPGQPVQVNSWESGVSCEAKITEIMDYPASNAEAYSGEGNSNVSYYPYTAYIEDTAGLQNGEYVDLTMTVGSEDGADTIYLPKAYVRTGNGVSYVYKADENSRLVKQYVKTGRTIYGQSVEIKSGIGMEDLVAFPYGKTAKEGVRAVESEMDY